jgi:hypothetical protein
MHELIPVFPARHNGIVIEPEQGKKEDINGSAHASGSKSPSRSVTPSGKIRSRDSGSSKSPPNALAHPGTAGPSGSSSYYRQHTVTSNGLHYIAIGLECHLMVLLQRLGHHLEWWSIRIIHLLSVFRLRQPDSIKLPGPHKLSGHPMDHLPK